MKDHRETAALPPLFRRHTRRPRLTSLIDEATAQAILITAPAGYGKTTLAQEWLQGRDGVAWYGATAASADLAAFSSGVADAVDPIVPGAGDRLKQRLRVGDAPEKAVRPLAELMGEDLRDWPAGAWLVIDDYHLVMESAPVEEFVDWLLMLAPLRLLVTSRRRPAWASARRVLYGEILEIGRDQLAMTDEEARRVLSNRPDEAVRALVRQAEGWPALIGLAALSASLELPEQRVSDALFRYFAEEVLRRQPPDVQRFMLLASIPATIDARVAREVLGFGDPEPMLDRLSAEDIIHEDAGGQFAFHPLLREFLSIRLRRTVPRDFEELLLIAFDDAREREHWQEALELTSQAGRADLAASVVGDAATELLAAGRVETVEKWLAMCAAHAFEQPKALLAHTEVLTRRGRFSEAALVAHDLASGLPADSEHASQAWCSAGRALHLVSEDVQALECHQRARETARMARDLENALWGCFLAAGELEMENASAYLDELERVSAPSLDSSLRLAAGRVLAAERTASYAGVSKTVEPLIALAEHGSDPMVKSSFLARAAELSTARGQYAIAYELAQRAISVCDALNLDFARSLCLLSRANAELGLKDYKLVRGTVAELATLEVRSEDPYVRLATTIVLLKLALFEQRPVHSLVELDEPAPELQKSAQGAYWSLLAIGATVAHEVDMARYALERARASRALEPVYYARFAELLLHLTRDGDSQSSVQEAASLVKACAANEVLDALVVAYRSYPVLLQLIRRDKSAVSIARRALILSGDEKLGVEAGIEVSRPHVSLAAKSLLTRREREVLQLVAEGLTNAEIANALYISESTTKVHVHHILEKVGARSRLQAVVKAKELLASD